MGNDPPSPFPTYRPPQSCSYSKLVHWVWSGWRGCSCDFGLGASPFLFGWVRATDYIGMLCALSTGMLCVLLVILEGMLCVLPLCFQPLRSHGGIIWTSKVAYFRV